MESQGLPWEVVCQSAVSMLTSCALPCANDAGDLKAWSVEPDEGEFVCNVLIRLVLAPIVGVALSGPAAAVAGGLPARCDSPFIESLLDTPMRGVPDDAAHVLEILAMKVDLNVGRGNGCASVRPDLLARYLENLWLLGPGSIPSARTVRDAIKIEMKIEAEMRSDPDKPGQPINARPFAIAPRAEGDPLPYNVQGNPEQYEELGMNLWRYKGQYARSVWFGVAFTNLTRRSIFLPDTSLQLKRPDGAGYVEASCSMVLDYYRYTTPLRKIAPAQKVIFSCHIDDKDWLSDEFGLQLLESLQSPKRWWLKSSFGSIPLRMTWLISELKTPESSARAAALIKASTCEDRDTCTLECVPDQLHNPSCPDSNGCFEGQYQRVLTEGVLAGHGKVFTEKSCKIDLVAMRRQIKEVQAVLRAPPALHQSDVRVVAESDDLSPAQAQAQRELLASYLAVFTILSRAKKCGVDMGNSMEELLAEFERRHDLQGKGPLSGGAIGLVYMRAVLGGNAISLPCSLFDERVRKLQLPPVPTILRAPAADDR